MGRGISLAEGFLWTLAWFGVMLCYTALDVAVWRKILPAHARLLNVISIAVCMVGFLILLKSKCNFRIDLAAGISLEWIILAISCAAIMYLLLDKFLDPIFESMMPGSEAGYRESIEHLREAPALGFVQTCVLAPVMEEILMRGFLLGGLSENYGKLTALLISSALFALLHFNMVQTLSALICGVAIGLLYMHTGSVVCCIIAHAGYNAVEFLTEVRGTL